MKFGIKLKILLVFGLLSILTISNYSLIVYAENISDNRQHWFIHTYKVIAVSEKFLGYLRDTEVGQRGYLLTNNKKYLSPYQTGSFQAIKSFQELKTLTRDNSLQQKRLDIIFQLTNAKLADLGQTIMLSMRNKKDEALVIVNSEHGKIIMDTIRDHFNDFKKEEEQLLKIREAEYNASHDAMRVVFAIEALLLIAVLFVIGFMTQRNLVDPLVKLTNWASKLSSGSVADVNYTLPPKNKNDELTLLTEAFINMYAEVQDRTERLKSLAKTDPLTGAYNRRVFNDELNKEIKRAKRYGTSLSIIIFDIDNFKTINDTYGHDVGDTVIKAVVDYVHDQQRETDVFARYGGEEFALILPQADMTALRQKAERIRSGIENLEIHVNHEHKLSITVSLGGTEFNHTTMPSGEAMLKTADKAMYCAKNNGRNRVELSG